MKIIADTSIWSLALRRDSANVPIVTQFREFIADGRVVMFGASRQELLSGIRHQAQFERLADHLRAFPDLQLEEADYETAASYFNLCRQHGVQGANTDFLICAVAARRDFEIFTTDKDFHNYKSHLPISLVE